jgi:capsular polysaccharide biosynthesis protein
MTTTARPNASPMRRKGILNRITDRWWLILVLWVVVTVPLLYLIRVFAAPAYEAVSILQVQPIEHGLYGSAHSESVDYDRVTPYLQTQVSLITTDRVLTTALADSAIKNFNFIKESDDPRADLRESLRVEIVANAYLIRVALALPDAKEAAAIVNSVVSSYLAYNGDFKRSENHKLRVNLSSQREKIRNEIKIKRAALNSLSRRSGFQAVQELLAPNESGKVSDPTRSTFSTITEEQRRQIASEMVKTDLEVIRAQAILETKQAAIEGENDLKARQALAELTQNLASLVKQKEYQAKYLSRLKIENKVGEYDAFEETFLNHELDVLMKSDDHLKTNLEELDFQASQEDYRVALVDDAKAPSVATTNDRIKYMVAAPIVVLLMLYGLCLVTPLKNEPFGEASAKPTPQDEIGH